MLCENRFFFNYFHGQISSVFQIKTGFSVHKKLKEFNPNAFLDKLEQGILKGGIYNPNSDMYSIFTQT